MAGSSSANQRCRHMCSCLAWWLRGLSGYCTHLLHWLLWRKWHFNSLCFFGNRVRMWWSVRVSVRVSHGRTRALNEGSAATRYIPPVWLALVPLIRTSLIRSYSPPETRLYTHTRTYTPAFIHTHAFPINSYKVLPSPSYISFSPLSIHRPLRWSHFQSTLTAFLYLFTWAGVIFCLRSFIIVYLTLPE